MLLTETLVRRLYNLDGLQKEIEKVEAPVKVYRSDEFKRNALKLMLTQSTMAVSRALNVPHKTLYRWNEKHKEGKLFNENTTV